jgi:Trypsin-co-occurring domain 2
MADPVVVALSEAIGALREELMAAIDEGTAKPMRFKVDPVELVLQVAVTKEAEGKIGWKILGLGGSHSSATMQTLTLKLTPLWRAESGGYVEDFMISDQTAQKQTFGPTQGS